MIPKHTVALEKLCTEVQHCT